MIKMFDESKAPGIDDLSEISLKDGASLATPITQLCNLSISSGRFPDDWKIAKLKPLFKKGSKTDPRNYRPICLLPLMSKVLERIVHEQTMEFLDKHNIQSGFRKNHSTDFCLSYLTDKISKGFDSGLLTGMILNWPSKNIRYYRSWCITSKNAIVGFSREVIDWYKSYLSSRKFHVHVHDKLPLPIYDAEFHKDPFLDLCYFCCI